MHEAKQQLTSAATRNPAAKRWADRTAELLTGFCLDVYDSELERYDVDEQLIYSGAWQLWQAHGSGVCWSKLDVEHLLRQFGDDPDLRGELAVTLMAFYCFLVKHQHLARKKALGAVDQLEPLWRQACAQMIDRMGLPRGVHQHSIEHAATSPAHAAPH